MADQTFEHAFFQFRSRLTAAELNDFQGSTAAQVQQAMSSVSQLKRNSRVHAKMTGFLRSLEQYGKVVEVFASSTPYFTYIWVDSNGPFHLLLVADSYRAGPSQIHLDRGYLLRSLALLVSKHLF